MSPQGTAFQERTSNVARLSEFFSEAIQVRIPVWIRRLQAEDCATAPVRIDRSRVRSSGSAQTLLREDAVIEFGTPREVLFACGLPLDFGDHIRVSNNDGSLDAEGTVMAMQCGEGKPAFAVRFVRDVPNWIIKS